MKKDKMCGLIIDIIEFGLGIASFVFCFVDKGVILPVLLSILIIIIGLERLPKKELKIVNKILIVLGFIFGALSMIKKVNDIISFLNFLLSIIIFIARYICVILVVLFVDWIGY